MSPAKKRENVLYRWVADRPMAVAFAALALGAVAAFVAVQGFLLTRSEVHDFGVRVTKVEGPCQRYGPDSKICERAFEEAATSINHRMACFFQHRAGVHPPSCRGVHLSVKEPSFTTSPVPNGGGRGSSGGGQTSAPSSPGGAEPPVPGKGHGTHGGSGPGNSGNEGGGAPGSGDGGNPDESSGSGGPPQGSPETSAPESPTGSSAGVLPETLEGAGKAAGEVVGKAGEAAQGAVEGLGKGLGDTVGGG